MGQKLDRVNTLDDIKCRRERHCTIQRIREGTNRKKGMQYRAVGQGYNRQVKTTHVAEYPNQCF